MKLKTSIIYQMRTLTIGAGIFFIVLTVILAVLHFAIALTKGGSLVNIDKFDVNFIDFTVGFIIVVSIITSIKHNFKYFIQNGCSRWTIFNSTTLTYLFFSVISAAFIVLIHIPKLRVGTNSMFQLLYGHKLVEQLLWTTVFLFMICVIFYLLTSISALLSHKQNLIAGAVLAVLGLVIIPALNLILPNWNVIQRLFNGVQTFFGKLATDFSALRAITHFSIVIMIASIANLLVIKRIQLYD